MTPAAVVELSQAMETLEGPDPGLREDWQATACGCL